MVLRCCAAVRWTRALLLGGFALATAGACRTTTSESPVAPAVLVITRTLPVRAWEVWADERLQGSVVRYEDPADSTKAYFSVRNREQQELGMIDVQGRTWRYRPHALEPEWLGTSTVLEGTRRILGGGAPRLIEVGLDRLRIPTSR